MRDRFWNDLLISLSWLRTGVSQRVRYEDLWRDPVATLQALTAHIAPVSTDAIDLAVEKCQIDLVRQLPGIDRTFFRHGRVGDWRTAVPASIVALLRDHEPPCLPATLDPTDRLSPRRPGREPAAIRSGHLSSTMAYPWQPCSCASSCPFRRAQPAVAAGHLDTPGSFYAWMKSQPGPILTRSTRSSSPTWPHLSTAPAPISGRLSRSLRPDRLGTRVVRRAQ